MKHNLAAVLAIALVACSADKAPSQTPPRRERIERFKKATEAHNEQQKWQPIGHNLWKSKSGDIAFRTEEMTEEGIGIVHYRTELCCDGPALRDVIDQATFRQLKRSSFYRDKDHIYHHFAMADGGTFSILDEVDKDTFEVVTGCYARDKGAIYTDRARKLADVDMGSFVTSEKAGCFAKDKKSYFFWDERIGSLDELDAPAREAIRELGPL